jgi:predicted secreted protein
MYLFGLVISGCILATTAFGVSVLLSKKPMPAPTATQTITMNDNGTTIAVKAGDHIRLELNDYGDGGYSWTIVHYDDSLLQLTERTNSTPSGMLGDFGNDIWVFTAEHAGSTSLQLTCSRSWEPTDICATFSITIEIQ